MLSFSTALILFLLEFMFAESKWPIEAKLELNKVVCPYVTYNTYRMYILAEKYRVTKARPPHYACPYPLLNPSYGYFELFICRARGDISSGCAREIRYEQNYRYAHVSSLEFSVVANHLTQNENNLVNYRKFDICMLDATKAMREVWEYNSKRAMRRGRHLSFKEQPLPSAYERLQFPRKCWRIQLHKSPIDAETRRKMKDAKEARLAIYRKRREQEYRQHLRPHQEELDELKKNVNKIQEILENLIEQYKNDRQLAAELEETKKVGKERLRVEEQKRKEAEDKVEKLERESKSNVNKEVEEEKRKIEEVQEKNTTTKVEVKTVVRHTLKEQFSELLIEQGLRRRKRDEDVSSLIETLKKEKPRKQHTILNLGANNILPLGNLNADDLIKEIAKVESKSVDQVLEMSPENWEEIAQDDAKKQLYNEIAIMKMDEALEEVENALWVDKDLAEMISEQKSFLSESIKEAATEEKKLKEQGVMFNENCDRLLEEAKQLEEKEDQRETNEHGYQQYTGKIGTALQKSGELIKKVGDAIGRSKVGEHLGNGANFVGRTLGRFGGEIIEKYELGRKAKAIAMSAMAKSKEVLGRIVTAGIPIVKGAKDQAIEGMNTVAVGADLWKSTAKSEAYKAEHPHPEDEHWRKMEKLHKEHPEVYQDVFEN